MNAITQTVTVDENLLKTLYVIYKDPTGSISRSDLTRGMIQKNLKNPTERETLIQEARDQKLINVGRKIQLNKGGQNPLVYRITKKGIDVISPYCGDDDLADHER